MSIGRSTADGGCVAPEDSSSSAPSSDGALELLLLLLLLLLDETLSSEEEEFPWRSNSGAGVTVAGPRLDLRIAATVAAIASSEVRDATQKYWQFCKVPQSTLHKQGGFMKSVVPVSRA